MTKKDTSYRMPEGFNPYSALDAVKGLADAIHWMHFEGPAAEETIAFADKLGLDGLVDLLRTQVRQLHEYLHELGNSTSLHLPMSDEEFEELRWRGADRVREVAPLYNGRVLSPATIRALKDAGAGKTVPIRIQSL